MVLGFGTTKRQIREKLKEKGYDATLQHERKIAILLYFNNALRYVIPTRNCSHRSCPRFPPLLPHHHPSHHPRRPPRHRPGACRSRSRSRSCYRLGNLSADSSA